MIYFKCKQNKLPNDTIHACTSKINLHSVLNIFILVIGKAIHNTIFFFLQTK